MQAIKKETSGNFESALLTILRCATDPAMYFAKVFVVLKLSSPKISILFIVIVLSSLS